MQPAFLQSLPKLFRRLTHREGLQGKVMCGYQGWFRVPGDATGMGWDHFGKGDRFEPGVCTVDLWPDLRDLPIDDRFDTSFRHSDGTVAQVFSSARPSTVMTHFDTMSRYGIDGAFLHRSSAAARNSRLRASMDSVLNSVRVAAHSSKVGWAMMYDLTEMRPGEADGVIADWKRVQAQFRLRDPETTPEYLHHRGKPLVGLWGVGFADRLTLVRDWLQLIEFFKNDPKLGGCSVLLGVPAYWRALNRDSIADPRLHELIAAADVISPWTVGQYGSPTGVRSYAHKVLNDDMAWCRARSIDILPVAFPGFSNHNLANSNNKSAPLDAIPRLGGRFLWSQFKEFHYIGAEMFYTAMFDGLNDGTAIFKCRQNPPVGQSPFVAEPDVPVDNYLWLTGMARKVLQGTRLREADDLPVRVHHGTQQKRERTARKHA